MGIIVFLSDFKLFTICLTFWGQFILRQPHLQKIPIFANLKN